MIDNSKEYVLTAAIWYKDLPLKQTFTSSVLPINCDRGLVFCGHRHGHCMYTMISITGLRSVKSECGDYTQGFLTSRNRFVDRKEAAIIAIASGQIIKPEYEDNTLFSEDIY